MGTLGSSTNKGTTPIHDSTDGPTCTVPTRERPDTEEHKCTMSSTSSSERAQLTDDGKSEQQYSLEKSEGEEDRRGQG